MPEHIKVEIDFIPVEERLPESKDEGIDHFLLFPGCPVSDMIKAMWLYPEKEWCAAPDYGDRVSPDEVAGWAEIPKIEGG